MNKVAIFEMDLSSLMSILIAGVTKTPWTHAAIRINGKWYDSSESRGNFQELNINDYTDRWCVIINIDYNLDNWLLYMKNKKYNWKGVFQFPLYFLKSKNNNNNKFYCFQAIWDAIWFSLYKEHYTPTKVSARSLKLLIQEMIDSPFIYTKGLK